MLDVEFDVSGKLESPNDHKITRRPTRSERPWEQ
jgi:hypothetical protein